MLARIDRWLFRPASATYLAAMRIGLFAIVTCRLLFTDWTIYSAAHTRIFEPVGVATIIWPHAPSATVVIALQIIGVIFAVAACVGVYTRYSMIGAFVILIALSALHTSQGKLMHNDVLLIIACTPLLFSPCFDRWALRASRQQHHQESYGFWSNLVVAGVVLTYAVAGAQKLRFSGPDWAFSDNLHNILLGSISGHTPGSVANTLMQLPSGLLQTVAASTVLFELSFFLLLSSKLRPWGIFWALGAVGLHVGIGVAMGLDYSRWVAVDLVVLIPWGNSIPQWQSFERRGTVLYDADCGFCRLMTAIVLTLAHGNLDAASIQGSVGQSTLAHLDEQTQLRSWHIQSGEQVWSAGAGFAPAAKTMGPIGGIGSLGIACLPPALLEWGYKLVATNRHKLGPHVPKSWRAWALATITNHQHSEEDEPVSTVSACAI